MKRILLLFATLIPALAWGQTDTLALTHFDEAIEKPVRTLNHLSYKANIDCPAEGVVGEASRAWIEQLISADLNLPQMRYAQYGKAYQKRTTKELKDIAKQMRGEAQPPRLSYSYDITVRRGFETAHFITLYADTYNYTAGAHGTQLRRFATFNKATGALLTWSDLFTPASQPRLRTLVTEGLSEFFGVKTYTDLRASLFEDQMPARANEFPLPKGNPGLMANGLHALYNSYEIAPHAAGQPVAIIAYDKLKGMWTRQAVALWRYK